MCHWLYKRCTKCGYIPYTSPVNCGKGTIELSHFGYIIECPEVDALAKEKVEYRDGECKLHCCFLPKEGNEWKEGDSENEARGRAIRDMPS
jgi:hypothetical protein